MVILFVVQRITLCKSIIETDDRHRRTLGLPTPSLEDFKEMHGLKPMKAAIYRRFMVHHGLFDPKKPQPQNAGKPDSAAGGFQGKNKPKRGRGRGQPYPRGRGGRGGRGGVGPQDYRHFGRSPPSQYNRYYFLWNLLC